MLITEQISIQLRTVSSLSVILSVIATISAPLITFASAPPMTFLSAKPFDTQEQLDTKMIPVESRHPCLTSYRVFMTRFPTARLLT